MRSSCPFHAMARTTVGLGFQRSRSKPRSKQPTKFRPISRSSQNNVLPCPSASSWATPTTRSIRNACSASDKPTDGTEVMIAKRKWVIASLGIGICVTLLGILAVPAYNWEGQPVRSWLSFALFPYGTILTGYPVYELHPRYRDALNWCRVVVWLGQFPTYGLLIAAAGQSGRLRLWGYALLMTHATAVCIAGALFYRWVAWCDLTFGAFFLRIGLSLAAGFIIGLGVSWFNCRRYDRPAR